MFLIYLLMTVLAILLTFGIVFTLSLPWWQGVLVGIVLYCAGLIVAMYLIRRFNESREFNFHDYDH